MTIIKGILEGKRLSFQKQSANEGEAHEAHLEISVPPQDNVKYYLEFLCPYDRKYLSVALDATDGIINYTLPSCIFLVAGKVYAQLIVLRDSVVIFKSVKSADASIDVLPSINAAEEANEQRGFLAEAEFTLSLVRETIQSVTQKAELLEQKSHELENLIQTVSESLSNKEFEGKTAYSYAIEGGFAGSEQEFAAALARAESAVEDAPESGKYLRARGEWLKATELPEPSLERLGSVLTVSADGEQAKYVLAPVAGEDAEIDADSEELIALARLDANAVFCGKKLFSLEQALNGEGNYKIRYIFQGELVVQVIEDEKRGIRYKRTKNGTGAYSIAVVEPIIPIKIENVQLLPEMFIRKQHFFEAALELRALCGLNISNGAMPILTLAESSRMTAYNCNLNKGVTLNDGRLIMRTAMLPEAPMAADILILGTN